MKNILIAISLLFVIAPISADATESRFTGLDVTNTSLAEGSHLVAPHPAAVAYREALGLLNSDPAAARAKAEETLELLGEDAPAEDRLEVRTLIALADQLAEPDDRGRAGDLHDILKERDETGMRDSALSARGWLELSGFASREKDWPQLADYAKRAEEAVLAVAPNAINPRAVAITYQGIARFKRHDPSDRSLVPEPRRKAFESRAQETIAIFERGIALYPPQESYDNFNKNLAILIAWQSAANIYYLQGNPEGAREFFSSDERVYAQYPKRSVPPEACEFEWIERPPAEYPREAARKGYIGAAIVLYDLKRNGRVTNARPLASVPDSYFTPAALKSMEKWRARIDQEMPDACLPNWRVEFHFLFED